MSDDPPICVLSGSAMFRRTFGHLVETAGRTCTTGAELPVDAACALVIADLGAGEADAAAARTRALLATARAPVAAVIDHPDEAVVDAVMAAGASGVLVKATPPAALGESLALLLAGMRCRPAPAVAVSIDDLPGAVRDRLGARDRKMLRLVSGGASVPAVAAALHLTPAKVVTDMRRIMDVVRGRG